MSTVIAYVDGFNLYYGMRAKHGHRYYWLDLAALVRRLRPTDTLIGVRYFTAPVRGEPTAAANQSTYLDALVAHSQGEVETVLGRFVEKKPRCRECRTCWVCACTPPHIYRTYEEKATDVAIGARLVEDSATGASDVALIVSADTDLVPAVEAAQRVCPSRSVYMALPPGQVRLSKYFTTVGHFNINETALRASQLPPVVQDTTSGALYSRPAKWK
ncbi:NYN domain-containing protein [Streptomyces rectiviolaceus]|uniref:NYN domain-containing protein n=1 Tax=Streptomyces rectiviolaceus TaxID=332591 RepID=A0ABP6NAC4_9ACTN